MFDDNVEEPGVERGRRGRHPPRRPSHTPPFILTAMGLGAPMPPRPPVRTMTFACRSAEHFRSRPAGGDVVLNRRPRWLGAPSHGSQE